MQRLTREKFVQDDFHFFSLSSRGEWVIFTPPTVPNRFRVLYGQRVPLIGITNRDDDHTGKLLDTT